MLSRRTLAILGLVLLVVLAGCGGLGSDGADDDAATLAGDADDSPDDRVDDADTANGASDTDAAAEPLDRGIGAEPVDVPDRDLIRTGEVTVVVDDTVNASETVMTVVRDGGGFVEASAREQHGEGETAWTSETIVVRIPSEAFDVTIRDFEALGEVERSETESEDVTDQLVDIEARLENLEAERDRLRELFEAADETDDVLAIQRELADVQEEIEVLAAQERSLEDRVAYSTITVHLTEEEPTPPAEPGEPSLYERSVVATFTESVEGVVLTLRSGVVVAAMVAPYAITFGTPVAGVAGLYWYRRRKRRPVVNDEPQE